MSERQIGTVTWFDSGKGDGFIERQTGTHLFVPFRSSAGERHRSLVDGQKVEFTETQGQKGPQADNVVAL